MGEIVPKNETQVVPAFAQVSPEEAEETVRRYHRVVDSAIPSSHKYYSVTYYDQTGKQRRFVTASRREAQKIARQYNATVAVHFTRAGLRTLALALGAEQAEAPIRCELSECGGIIFQTLTAPGFMATLQIVNGKPRRTDVIVAVAIAGRWMTGAGSATTEEVGEENLLMVAHTRALNRAIQDLTGTSSTELGPESISVSDELDAAGFVRLLAESGIPLNKALEALGIKSLGEITSFADAARTVLSVLGGGGK